MLLYNQRKGKYNKIKKVVENRFDKLSGERFTASDKYG